MDAHLFRRLARELPALLNGGLIEKIHSPLPDCRVITLYCMRRTQYLVLYHARKDPVLYLSSRRPVSPAGPGPADSATMLLRKHLKNRRISETLVDWPARRLALRLSGQGIPFVLLDIRHGIQLKNELPENFSNTIDWTQLEDWPNAEEQNELHLGALPRERRAEHILTPPLWRTCAAVFQEYAGAPAEAILENRALLTDLEDGGGAVFLYSTPAPESRPELLSAWPLPQKMLSRPDLSATCHDNPVAATQAYGDAHLERLLATCAQRENKQPDLAEIKHLRRIQNKLEQEEKRLQAMIQGQEYALLIQAHLFALDRNARLHEVTVPQINTELCAKKQGTDQKTTHNSMPPQQQVKTVTIALNPRLTVAENMERFFHHAARGKRGLIHLEQRRADIQADLSRYEKKPEDIPGALLSLEKSRLRRTGAAKQPTPQRPGKRAKNNEKTLQSISVFRSSDGYTILRGRNAQGNAALLRMAAAHDYWLHTQDGPSAHVLIRRPGTHSVVPEQSLTEAAQLCADKSPWRTDTRAAVMLALAKDIRPIKGSPGNVTIRELIRTLNIIPDPTVEATLLDDAAPKERQ